MGDNFMYGESFEDKLEISAALGCQGRRREKREGAAGHKVALCVARRHWSSIRLSWQCHNATKPPAPKRLRDWHSEQKPKSLMTTKRRSFSLSEAQIEAFHRPSCTPS
jgi:hypothetical protein